MAPRPTRQTDRGPARNRSAAVSRSARIVRPEDLVVLEVEMRGFDYRRRRGVPHAIPSAPRGAFIIVRFPGQHIAERAYFETDGKIPVRPPTDPDSGSTAETPDAPPVAGILAGHSRLVFTVPDDFPPIPYTAAGILEAIGELQMTVAPTALPRQPEVSPWLLPWLSDNVTVALESSGLLRRSSRTRSGAFRDPDALIVGSRAMTQLRQLGEEPTFPITLPPGGEVDRPVRRIIEELGIAVKPVPGIRPRLPQPQARGPIPQPPTSTQTAIEAPWRLIISPNVHGGWAHSADPVASREQSRERIELWHTRLGIRSGGETDIKGDRDPVEIDERDDHRRTIRAIWALDPGFTTDPKKYPTHSNAPFRMSLDALDRNILVNQTANWQLRRRRAPITPAPVDVNRLMLSSLGAWLDLDGQWDTRHRVADAASIEQWQQISPMGRDQFVKVVYPGYLFPFGHGASLVKITQRKVADTERGPVAYLFQRMFVVVRVPQRLYGQSGSQPTDRKLPFRRMRIITEATPNIEDPSAFDILGKGQDAFWVTVSGQPFPFQSIVEDHEGRPVELNAPALFIAAHFNENAAFLNQIASAYTADSRSNVPLGGQQVAYAPASAPGNTTFATQSFHFGGAPGKAQTDGDAKFVPVVEDAAAVLASVQQLSGNAKPATVKYPDSYLGSGFNAANKGGLFLTVDTAGANAVDLNFGTQGDRSGGYVQPNLRVSGLSRVNGLVSGDPAKAFTGQFDPASFFPGGLSGLPSPLLFGVFSLADIVAAAGFDELDLIPKFVTESLTRVETLIKDAGRLSALAAQAPSSVQTEATALKKAADNVVGGFTDAIAGDPGVTLVELIAFLGDSISAYQDAIASEAYIGSDSYRHSVRSVATTVQSIIADGAKIAEVVDDVAALARGDVLPQLFGRTRMEWRPKLRRWPDSDGAIFVPRADGSFVLAVELTAQTDGTAPAQANVSCSLENFNIRLVPPLTMMELQFDRVAFRAGSNGKPDVDVQFGDVKFVGILSFVETLRNLIPLDGFSDPPSLDITKEGITADFSIALPNLAVGIFSLQNLSLNAGFVVPFIGDPLSTRFSFCTRERPFLLTVTLFGGGGFFGIEVTPKGVSVLEAAFEFGAAVSINLGVASGGVSVMAGVYFRMEGDDGSLTGYFRMRGELDVLGLISVSIELYLGLTYEFSSGKMSGRATLTIEVEILFFSFSVSVSVERKFAGANGDPTFGEVMGPAPGGAQPSPWEQYCKAFVEV